MSGEYLICLTTCGDRASAERVAGGLIEEGLAACVNIVPGVTSVFEWKGQVEHDEEVVLLIKTRDDRYDALEAAICRLHTYELPEVVAVPIKRGLHGYLSWIDELVGKHSQ